MNIITGKWNEHKLKWIVQPTDTFDIHRTTLVCPAMTILTENQITLTKNNASWPPYTIPQSNHIETFSVLTPEEHRHLRSVDPADLKHLTYQSPEHHYQYVKEILEQPRNQDIQDHYLFPTPDNQWDLSKHTPIQARTLAKLYKLQKLEQLDQTKQNDHKQRFLQNFSRDYSTFTAKVRKQWKFIY